MSSPQSSSHTVLASKASYHLSLSLSPASVKAIFIHLENYTSTGGNFLVLVMIMLVLCSQYTVSGVSGGHSVNKIMIDKNYNITASRYY